MSAAVMETSSPPEFTALLPLVQRLARQLISRLPASVLFDDILQAGMIGLLDAVRRFDRCHGAELTTFATQRIRGAMLDELRAGDCASRELRRAQRAVDAAIARLEQSLGRAPRESEVARALALTMPAYHEVLTTARAACPHSIDDFDAEGDTEASLQCPDDSYGPHDLCERLQFARALTRATDRLPERERRVLQLYYQQDQSFREIATALGITVSRVCQVHRRALEALRRTLSEWQDFTPPAATQKTARARTLATGCAA